MLRISNLVLARGAKRLLDDANLTVHAGHNVGLVGPNGSGKSSLFALVRGELHPDAGEIELPSAWTIAHVAQETPAAASPAVEFVLDGDRELREIDLKNWRSNQKNSGFLPEERAWLTRVFDELGFVDVFRRVDPRPERYTWWSNRGQAWEKNVGWRIDYQVATSAIAAKAQRAAIYTKRRFSDHAPLIIDYDYTLR